MNNYSLIIFVKNPVLGKVKTRLAATIGAEKALGIYRQLLTRTQTITQSLPWTKALYYADFIPEHDQWDAAAYTKHLQSGPDLGTRMENAFAAGFAQRYQRICIIGSDCFQLTTAIIQEAFATLAHKDVVIGPAQDGGYYLLGMREPHPFLFKGITWSTASVLAETLQHAAANHLSVGLLPTLSDVDEEKDLITLAAD